MSFKPVFIFSGDERCMNGQCFATKGEALGSARARFNVWVTPKGFDAEESTDPVNYRWSFEPGDASVSPTATTGEPIPNVLRQTMPGEMA